MSLADGLAAITWPTNTGTGIPPLALAAAAGGFLLSGCSPSPNAITQASPGAQRNHSSGIIMNRDIADRFPGATVLGEAEFASAIVGRRFRYREVGSELVINRPKEFFLVKGQYQIQGARSMSYGTYSMKHGIISIDCADCTYPFLDLCSKRIFFRHQGRLLTARASLEGTIFELIPES